MSGFIPTTQVLVLALQQGEDEYGDPVDEYARSRKAEPAHISETRVTSPDPSTGTMTVITNYTGILPGHLELARGYRLVDLKTDTTYVVERVFKRNTFVGNAPWRVLLQLVQ